MNIIDYITRNKGLKQKDIADRLNVSKAQVSKWKSGEYISYSKQEELNKLAGLFGNDTEWAVITKTKENTKAWCKYFSSYEKIYSEYEINCFSDDDTTAIYASSLLKSLQELGVKIPEKAPPIITCENDYIDTPFNNLISEIITMHGFIVEWWDRVTEYFDDTDLFDKIINIRTCLLDITLSHLSEEVQKKVGIQKNKLDTFTHNKRVSALKYISRFCSELIKKRYPITEDYFKVISENPYILSDELLEKDLFVSLSDFLPIGEKLIFEEICMLKNQIKELHLKIDKLASPKKIKKFNQKI